MHIPGYRILRTIGKGAMATAYLAEAAGESVVLKVLHPSFSPGGTAETLATSAVATPARLAREARVVSALRHPNIVRVVDSGEAEGVGYIAMEYLEGGDLETRIARGMGVREALGVAAALARALAHAHGKGVLHRDVKPSNVLFRRDATPVLSDFGVAKLVDDQVKMTQEGTAIGSPQYMSPEQAGDDVVDGRTDIYALGVVLFEMLTGRPPYTADSALAVIMKHLHADIPLLPEPLAGLQPLVEATLAKSPQRRVATADKLAALIEGFAGRISETGLFAAVPAPEEGEEAALPEGLLAHLRAGINEDLEFDRLILPSLPEVAIRVREAVSDPDVPAAQVARLIAVDPALSAQVIKMANSAFYPGRTPVTDIKNAVVRLGAMAVRHLVMVVVTAQLFQAKRSPDLAERIRRAWVESVRVAALSRAVAGHATALDPEEAFLAGLLHQIGVLPVLEWALKIPHLFGEPRQMEVFVARAHPGIGALILERWGYPEALVAAVREQGAVDQEAPAAASPAHVVALAGRLAGLLEAGEEAVAEPGEAWLAGASLAPETVRACLESGRQGAEEMLSILPAGP